MATTHKLNHSHKVNAHYEKLTTKQTNLACEKPVDITNVQKILRSDGIAAPTGCECCLFLLETVSIDKCFLINLCHQCRQRLKIELCFIELRWSLAQLKQLRVLIHQSIPCTIRGQTFADCCLYLFQALFREIAIWPWLSSLYGQLGLLLRLHTPGRLSLNKKTVKVITTQCHKTEHYQ